MLFLFLFHRVNSIPYSGGSSNFFSKFNVSTNFISQMSFSKIFQILFIVGPTFLNFIPECLNNLWWCFLSSFSTLEERRRNSLESWSVLLKIHGSYLLPSSQIVSNRVILFLPIRRISELFSFLDHPKAIISEDFFVLSFQLRSPIILN